MTAEITARSPTQTVSPSARARQFEAMLVLQNKMNSKVHPEWWQQNFAYYRALWIECAELMEHHGYKWWKQQEVDIEQVKLEIVDVWHFGLSMLIDGRTLPAIAAAMDAELIASPADQPDLTILAATESLASHTLQSREFSVPRFWQLLQSAGMNADQLYQAYVGKNVLNFFRQDNGYKQGSYQKLWAGREDNEHLVELSAELDAGAEDYETRLYNALAERYKSVI